MCRAAGSRRTPRGVDDGDDPYTSGTLCEDAMRAFDRLCALERTRDDAEAMLTPRQAHRRRLLEARSSAAEWIVPPEIAATVHALIDAADRIDDPALAFVWTDHLPVAVLACLSAGASPAGSRTATRSSPPAPDERRPRDDLPPGRTGAGTEGGIRTHTGLPPAVFETAASAIPPLRPGDRIVAPPGTATAGRRQSGHAQPACRLVRHPSPDPMLDSPRLTTATRRVAPVVEDARPSEAVDDPIQRRDLILLEQARDGSLTPSTASSRRTRITSSRSSPGWSRTATRPPTLSRRRSSPRTATCGRSAAAAVRSWLSRIAINAAMDQQRLKKRRPSQPYPELEDESWQPPAGPEADPVRTAMHGERARALKAALAAITPDQRYAIVLFDVEGYDYQRSPSSPASRWAP